MLQQVERRMGAHRTDFIGLFERMGTFLGCGMEHTTIQTIPEKFGGAGSVKQGLLSVFPDTIFTNLWLNLLGCSVLMKLQG